MSRKHTVFISLPMAGKTMEGLKDDIRKAKAAYFEMNPEKDISRVAFITGIDNEEPPFWMEDYDRQSVWYLGQSIRKMSMCDEIFFYGKWRDFRGCRMEHEACELYGLKVLEDGEPK